MACHPDARCGDGAGVFVSVQNIWMESVFDYHQCEDPENPDIIYTDYETLDNNAAVMKNIRINMFLRLATM